MEFEELYQEVILDHSRRPRNFGELPGADVSVEADNPMCGDEIALHLKFGDGDKIDGITFTGSGCSICMASASLMTQKLKKKSRAESSALMRSFHDMLTAEQETEPPDALGDLRLLKGVRKFPLRVKCATLAWHALGQALETPPESSGNEG